MHLNPNPIEITKIQIWECMNLNAFMIRVDKCLKVLRTNSLLHFSQGYQIIWMTIDQCYACSFWKDDDLGWTEIIHALDIPITFLIFISLKHIWLSLFSSSSSNCIWYSSQCSRKNDFVQCLPRNFFSEWALLKWRLSFNICFLTFDFFHIVYTLLFSVYVQFRLGTKLVHELITNFIFILLSIVNCNLFKVLLYFELNETNLTKLLQCTENQAIMKYDSKSYPIDPNVFSYLN